MLGWFCISILPRCFDRTYSLPLPATRRMLYRGLFLATLALMLADLTTGKPPHLDLAALFSCGMLIFLYDFWLLMRLLPGSQTFMVDGRYS